MAKSLIPPANDSNSPTDFTFTERKFLSSSSGLEPDIAVDRPGFHLNEKDIQDDLIEKFFQQYCKPPSIFASLETQISLSDENYPAISTRSLMDESFAGLASMLPYVSGNCFTVDASRKIRVSQTRLSKGDSHEKSNRNISNGPRIGRLCRSGRRYGCNPENRECALLRARLHKLHRRPRKLPDDGCGWR